MIRSRHLKAVVSHIKLQGKSPQKAWKSPHGKTLVAMNLSYVRRCEEAMGPEPGVGRQVV